MFEEVVRLLGTYLLAFMQVCISANTCLFLKIPVGLMTGRIALLWVNQKVRHFSGQT